MAQPSPLLCVIVGKDDFPIYEADLTSKNVETARDVRIITMFWYLVFFFYRNLSVGLMNDLGYFSEFYCFYSICK